MARLNELDKILFPVEEHPVFASVKTESGERKLPIPEKKAIVNSESGRVLGVVSRGYRLVSNKEALDMAKLCCQTVFPETKPIEWEVRATDAPLTGGHCFIDLEHNSTSLDFNFVPAQNRPDAYGPFIRVANSFNGLRALSFDIGYYRKICKNGMILQDLIIHFKFIHMKRDIGKSIEFEINYDKLAEARAGFGRYLSILQKYVIGREKFEPLVLAVLLLNKPKKAKSGSREAADWDALQKHLKGMCDRYANELGENAYAVFNTITEFASHPPDNRCVHRERQSFQRLAGIWLNDFSREFLKPDFKLEKYIEKASEKGSRFLAGRAE